MPYAEFDEIRLHIRQQGSGPVALFIHGFPLDSTMWIDQLNAMSSMRRCIAVDLRGHGRSSPVTGVPLTMDEHAADLAAVLDLVSEEKADIIGLSMGGYVALAFADLYPGRVRSLALVDTKSGADSEEARAGRDALAARLLVEGRRVIAADMVKALLAPEAPVAAKARLLSMIEGCPYETIVASLAGMRDRPDRTSVLPTISVPSAVIVGELDGVTPPSEAELLAEALPDSELTVIPDAGHLSPMENPGAVTEALRALLLR